MNRSKIGWPFVLAVLTLSACNSGGSGGGSTAPAPLPPASSVQVASTFPQNGAVQVPLNTSVSVQFSGLVDPSTVQPYSFALYLGLGGVNQVAGSVSCDGISATFVPAAPLKSLAAYRAVLTTQILDASGLALAAEHSWTFWTQDTQTPFVTSTLPLAQAQFLPLTTTVHANFSEPVAGSTVNAASFFLTGAGGATVPATVSLQNGSAVLVPQAPLAENVWHTATLTGAITDLQGNALTPYSWSFLSTEFTAPTILSTFPANLEENVPFQNTVIQVFFSEPIDPLSVNDSTFAMTGPAGVLEGALSLNGSVLSFDPTLDFESETTYTVEVLAGVTDLPGNPLAAPYSFSFKSEIKVLGDPNPIAGSDSGATPKVAMNGLGDSATIFTKLSGGLKDVYGSFYSSVGGWSAPVSIESHGNNAQSLQLAVDGSGNAFAAWTQFQTTQKQRTRVNIFSPGAGAPPDAIQLGATDCILDPLPKVGADDAGKGIVIYREKVSGGKASLYWSWATLASPWSTPALLESDDTGDVKSLDLFVAPDGKACAVWAQDVGGSQNIYSSRFDGAAWSSPPDLIETNDDGIAQNPLVRGDGAGNYFALWQQKIDTDGNGSINNNKFSLFASRFVAGPSGGWDLQPTLIELDDAGDPSEHSLAVDSLGNAHAAWIQPLDSDPGGSSVYSNHFDASIGIWVGVRLVEELVDSVLTPRIMAPAPNLATIVWVQNENIFYQTAFTANLTLPAADWSVAVPLEAVDSFASDPAVATDGNGKKLAAWAMSGTIWANFFP